MGDRDYFNARLFDSSVFGEKRRQGRWPRGVISWWNLGQARLILQKTYPILKMELPDKSTGDESRSRFEIFVSFVEDLEAKARRRQLIINRQAMIGRKRDFIALARKWSPNLQTISEASFEEYMKKINCKFPSGPASRTDTRLRDLF